MDERIEVALKGEEFKRLLGNQFTEIRKEYGLKSVDIEILLYLSHCKNENTPSDIFRRIRINKGHISQGIDNLIHKGYISPLSDSEDRRVVHYIVNDSSKEVIDAIIPIKKNLEKRIFNGLSKEEISQYKEITYKILKNIEALSC